MAIDFSSYRMEAVKESHSRFWEGSLDRPLVSITMHGPYEPDPDKYHGAPLLSQANCHDLSISAEDIVGRMGEWLSTLTFLGDAYPMINMDAFGPGVLAAFCGAELDNRSGRVWFFPGESFKGKDISEIHAKYDPDNVYARRIKDIYKAGRNAFGDQVVFGMPDLGGNLDVAAVFRGTENLLIDLYDEPDEVQRLTLEIEQAWHEAYLDFSSVMSPGAFSDWAGLLSRTPSYILQCDFSYMIGNEMYDRFVLPGIVRDTEKLDHTMYHLDGIGALKHLERLLNIPGLDAVQWVPGEGQPGPMHWLDVYSKIRSAGKRMMLIGSPEDFVNVSRVMGGKDFYYQVHISHNDTACAEALLQIR